MRGQQGESLGDSLDQAVGGVDAAVLGDVQPDPLKIEFGERRETIALHRAARRFDALSSARRFRPRAFTWAASFDVGRGVYSANSPRSI